MVKKYEQQIAATCNATLLRCKLKSVVACITTHLKHCRATKSVVASWKKWKPVQLAATCCIYQWTGWLFFNIFIFSNLAPQRSYCPTMLQKCVEQPWGNHRGRYSAAKIRSFWTIEPSHMPTWSYAVDFLLVFLPPTGELLPVITMQLA